MGIKVLSTQFTRGTFPKGKNQKYEIGSSTTVVFEVDDNDEPIILKAYQNVGNIHVEVSNTDWQEKGVPVTIVTPWGDVTILDGVCTLDDSLGVL